MYRYKRPETRFATLTQIRLVGVLAPVSSRIPSTQVPERRSDKTVNSYELTDLWTACNLQLSAMCFDASYATYVVSYASSMRLSSCPRSISVPPSSSEVVTRRRSKRPQRPDPETCRCVAVASPRLENRTPPPKTFRASLFKIYRDLYNQVSSGQPAPPRFRKLPSPERNHI